MKFTPEQVIEMAREAGLPDAVGAHPAFKQALNIAADRALEAAAQASKAQIERWVDDRARYAASECEAAIRAMKEHQ